MDLSNRTLAMFLIAAIVVSMSLFLFDAQQMKLARLKITGLSTANATSGTTTLTVSTAGALAFVAGATSITWGTGTVNTANQNQRCNMTTFSNANYAAAACLGFSNVTNNLTLENQGNVNLDVTINSSVNSTLFLGGAAPVFQIVARNASGSNGCTGAMNVTAQDINGTFRDVCAVLSYVNGADRMDLIPNISFDYTASGSKTATIFAVGTY